MADTPLLLTTDVPPDTAWAAFDPEWYVQAYPEARGIDLSEVLSFYLERGRTLGHSPNPYFDEAWYLATYPEVELALQTGEAASGFAEYCQSGFRTRSPHWLFDDAIYAALYPDLSAETLANAGFRNRYDHFVRVGSKEGRIGHLFFDPAVYEGRLRPDAPGSPFGRFLRGLAFGEPERRTTLYFDPDWYRVAYPDVAAEIAAGVWTSALHHYLCNQEPRARNPLPEFDEAAYLDRYEDVAAEVTARHRKRGYDHFLISGAFELRTPSETVDLKYYTTAHPQVAEDLQSGRARDAFAHLLSIGRAAGLAAAPPREELPSEPLARALFRAQARIGLRAAGRNPLDFTIPDGVAPAVSVLMVLHDQFPLTMQALGSLRNNFAGQIELIIIDSGSTDETRHLSRYVRGARILRFDVNIGFVRGCNAALLSATADAVLYLNNDITLSPGAIETALRRLAADSTIGAVGGKVVRSHGLLQEAGCIVWRNGYTTGYARDRDPMAPEANFARIVDFCSGVFLMVRGEPLQALGGFDDAFAPAYYEETDLCIRLAREMGLRVLYDPDIVVTHLEFGSAGSRAAEQAIGRSHRIFVEKHGEWLRTRPPQPPATLPGSGEPPNAPSARRARARAEADARGTGYAGGPRAGNRRLLGARVLFIEDTIPIRMIGSGFVRSNDIVTAMAHAGATVTLFPTNGCTADLAAIAADMPDNVEVLHDRALPQLDQLLMERAGLFDVIWIARTHNLTRTRASLAKHAAKAPIILDTEAIVAVRDAMRAERRGETDFDVAAAVAKEFAEASVCHTVVAVSEPEAVLLRDAGFTRVPVLGHARAPRPTPRPFAQRAGMLFIGAIHDNDSPNYDSLIWFADEVLPLVEASLGWETRLTVVGYLGPDADLDALAGHMRITVRGPVADTAPLYDQHRLFVAPTRFAAGIPYKIHEAASFGLPVVATSLLAEQVGWADGDALLAADATDPAGFAARIVRLYRDEALWHRLRDGALGKLAIENNDQLYADTITKILRDALDG